MQKRGKFCPRCGTSNSISDAYCIRCGYSFRRKKKKAGLTQILIAILIGIALWIGLRLILKKPIIPTEFIDLVKNMTFSGEGNI